MITEILPNKSILFSRFFRLLIPVVLASVIIHIARAYPQYTIYSAGALIFILSFAAIIAFSFFVILRSINILPTGVVFDNVTKDIEIKYLFRNSQNITLEDIESYTYIKFRNRSGSFQGDFIYLKSGKKILISEFSLKDHRPFEQLLEAEKVPYKGEESPRLMRYYFRNGKI